MTEIPSDNDAASPRIVFMGTPNFATPSLRALVEGGLKPIAVVTGSDKKRGRGQVLSSTPIKLLAQELGIDLILQPESVGDPQFASEIQSLQADVIVVVAFRILPEAVFSASSLGTFNLHGSLLPKYRGAAPINRAVMAGEVETGVTTFLLQRKVDTGNVIMQRSMSISPDETAGDIHDRMMLLGAEVVLETSRRIIDGRIEPLPQDDSLATPAPKIFKNDCAIRWSDDVGSVHNHVRGLSPFPGAYTNLKGKQLKIFKTRMIEGSGSPGEILQSEGTIVAACGTGAVEVLEIQLAGKKRMSSADFLRGSALETGLKFSAD